MNRWLEAWIDWNLLLDTSGGPNHKGNYCSAPIIADVRRSRLLYQSSYYYIGHFSRYIRLGAKRVSCAASRDALETTAFVNSDGTIAVVVMNQRAWNIEFVLKIGERATKVDAPARSITTFIASAERQ